METLNATLTVNSQGIVLQSAMPESFLGYLSERDSLPDHVHINDRIILLSFLADVRENRITSPISIRLNGPDRRKFMPVIIYCISADDKAIQLSVETNCNETGNIDMSAVSPFARAAHEMRTPLNAILGFADLLDYVDHQNIKNDKRYEYIAMIKKAGNHLLQIVNKTLQVHQQQADAAIPDDLCLVPDLINETLELTLPLQGHRKITLKGLETPVTCYLDTLSFRQICFNLISNAIKYSRDNGHIDIDIGVRDDDFCAITIEDDGIGMDEHHIARLGLPFLRASDVVACNIEGVGLGLAMVFDLVKRANGKISFESEKGKGTRVTLLLPLVHTKPVGTLHDSPINPVIREEASDNGYFLTPETKLRNNGKTTENTKNQVRKTA